MPVLEVEWSNSAKAERALIIILGSFCNSWLSKLLIFFPLEHTLVGNNSWGGWWMLLQGRAPAQWRGSPGNFAFVSVFCGPVWVTGHRLSPVSDLGTDLIQEMLDRAKKPGLPALAGVPRCTEWSVTQSCTLTGASWLQLGAGASPAMAYVRNQKVIKNSHRQVTQFGACLWNSALQPMQ